MLGAPRGSQAVEEALTDKQTGWQHQCTFSQNSPVHVNIKETQEAEVVSGLCHRRLGLFGHPGKAHHHKVGVKGLLHSVQFMSLPLGGDLLTVCIAAQHAR